MQQSSSIRIIAEAGVNHNGDIKLAMLLIDAAADAGADIVKFQTFRTDNVLSASAPKAAYQKKSAGVSESQLEMLRRLELAPEAFNDLAEHCRRRGIAFLSTPFDLESVDTLARMKSKLVKIPSGEITNLPYLRRIAAYDWDVLLSTGMSTLKEVGEALNALEQAKMPRSRVTLLHCTTEYPAPFHEVNLRAMLAMQQAFPGIANIGYSDHTTGISVSIAAAALGATVLEKHFTLDRNMDGPDHQASLEPHELKELVRAVREVELCLGDGNKKPTPSELPNMEVARKSIVAARDIRAGELFTEKNLTTKRPGNGVSPMRWDEFIGKPAPRDLRCGEML